MLVLFIIDRLILRLFYIKFKFLLDVFLFNGGCDVAWQHRRLWIFLGEFKSRQSPLIKYGGEENGKRQ